MKRLLLAVAASGGLLHAVHPVSTGSGFYRLKQL